MVIEIFSSCFVDVDNSQKLFSIAELIMQDAAKNDRRRKLYECIHTTKLEMFDYDLITIK